MLYSSLGVHLDYGVQASDDKHTSSNPSKKVSGSVSLATNAAETIDDTDVLPTVWM